MTFDGLTTGLSHYELQRSPGGKLAGGKADFALYTSGGNGQNRPKQRIVAELRSSAAGRHGDHLLSGVNGCASAAAPWEARRVKNS